MRIITTHLCDFFFSSRRRHTRCSRDWSSDVCSSDLLRDPNIIYNFHFYDPHVFTHQGANWSTNFVHYLKDLPYPSTPENVQQAAALVPEIGRASCRERV